MRVEALVVGPLQVNCFIAACPETGEAMVVDPGDEGARVLSRLSALGLDLKMVVNTHGHFDHVGGNALLVEETGRRAAHSPAPICPFCKGPRPMPPPTA